MSDMSRRAVLLKPVGFISSADGLGYEQPSTGCSIAAADVPSPLSDLESTLPASLSRRSDMTVVGIENLAGGEGPRIVIEFLQSVDDLRLRKLVALLGDESSSVLVTACCPITAPAAVVANLRVAVTNSKLQSPAPRQCEALFAEQRPGRLKLAQELNQSLAFTRDGALPLETDDAPLLVIHLLPTIRPAHRNVDCARQIFARFNTQRNHHIYSIEHTSTPAFDRFEASASAESHDHDTPLSIHHAALCFNHGTIYVYGSSAKGDSTLISCFQRVARSLPTDSNLLAIGRAAIASLADD